MHARETSGNVGGTIEQLLSTRERERHDALRSDKRQREWLLGRTAAKPLLCHLLRKTLAIDVPATAFELEVLETGAPIAVSTGTCERLPWRRDEPLPVHVSLSHSHQAAVSGMIWIGEGDPAARVGVDLEWIRPYPADVLRDVYSSLEHDYWAAGPFADADTRAMVIWTAKEATLKALGTGLMIDPQLVTCVPRAAPVDILALQPEWHGHALSISCAASLSESLSHASGCWQVRDGYAISVVAIE